MLDFNLHKWLNFRRRFCFVNAWQTFIYDKFSLNDISRALKEVLIINMVIYIYDEIQEFHTLKLRIEKIEYDFRKILALFQL